MKKIAVFLMAMCLALCATGCVVAQMELPCERRDGMGCCSAEAAQVEATEWSERVTAEGFAEAGIKVDSYVDPNTQEMAIIVSVENKDGLWPTIRVRYKVDAEFVKCRILPWVNGDGVVTECQCLPMPVLEIDEVEITAYDARGQALTERYAVAWNDGHYVLVLKTAMENAAIEHLKGK